jgi:hypothetical protein
VEVPGVVHVGPGERHIAELLLVGFVLPQRGLDPAEAESLQRQLRPTGVLVLRGTSSLSDLGTPMFGQRMRGERGRHAAK